ncbi:MAG: DHHA1 domain-containing protein, partial [Alphaproteobacteria bacterium]
RLKERFHRPACVIAFKDGIGKGSGRSVAGVHLGQAMHLGVHEGLLVHGGGHAMAAGFTVMQEQFVPFRNFLFEKLGQSIKTSPHTLTLEGILAPSGCTLELIEHLQCLEPFGTGNPNPRFAVNHVRCRFAESFSDNHIRASFVGEDGTELRGVAFRSANTSLGQFLLSRPQQHMHVAGTLKLDQWKGRKTISFFIEDVMPC